MADVRKERESAAEKLSQAQDNLKKVLSVQQEAVALAMGLVK